MWFSLFGWFYFVNFNVFDVETWHFSAAYLRVQLMFSSRSLRPGKLHLIALKALNCTHSSGILFGRQNRWVQFFFCCMCEKYPQFVAEALMRTIKPSWFNTLPSIRLKYVDALTTIVKYSFSVHSKCSFMTKCDSFAFTILPHYFNSIRLMHSCIQSGRTHLSSNHIHILSLTHSDTFPSTKRFLIQFYQMP